MPGTRTVATTTTKKGLYGFCDGNSPAALKNYQHRYQDRKQQQGLSCRMHVLAVEAAICGMRRMCWISHMVAAREQSSPSPVLAMGAIQDRGYHQFLCRTLWTDEAVFTRSGEHNLRNSHVSATQDHHAIRHSSFQQRFSASVWAGIVDLDVIGPNAIQQCFPTFFKSRRTSQA
jgi:hypothetical protein